MAAGTESGKEIARTSRQAHNALKGGDGMRVLMQRFIKILRIEMEDLETDIDDQVAGEQRKVEAHTETERVRLENVAILRNEAFGVHDFMRILDGLDVDDFDDLDHMTAMIRSGFRHEIEKRGLAQAVIGAAEHKIDRVERYVKDSEHWRRLQQE